MSAFGDFIGGLGNALGITKPKANIAGQQQEANTVDQRAADFANQLSNYQGRTAPGQGNTQVGPAAQAAMPAPMSAAQARNPAVVNAGQAQAADVGHTTLGPAATYQGVQTGPVANAGAASVGMDDQVRQKQLASLDTLQQAANGQAPSAAQEQLKQGLASNIAASNALKAGARGSGVARSESAAANAQEAATAATNQQAATLRAQEQATARGQLAEAQGTVRGQDIGVGTTNAQLGTQVDLANSGAFNASQQANANRAQQAASEGAAAQNALTGQQGNITAGEMAQRAALGTGVSTANAGLTTDVNKFGAGLGEQNQEFNAGATNDVGKFLAGLGTTTGIANMQGQNQLTGEQAQLNQLTGAQNQSAGLNVMNMDDQQRAALMQFILGSQGQGISAQQGIANSQLGQSSAQTNALHDTLGSIQGFATGMAGG